MTHNKTLTGIREAAIPTGKFSPVEQKYHVRCTYDLAELESMMQQTAPEYIVIGVVMPARSGAELCRLLQGDGGLMQYPVLLLSQEKDSLPRGIPHHRMVPATGSERPRLNLRNRMDEGNVERIELSDLTLIPGRHEVLAAGRNVDLTATEFKLLRLFAEKPGWVFSRDQIIESIRGPDYPCTPRSVDVLIVSLRRKLGAIGRRIQTVRGVGYRYME